MMSNTYPQYKTALTTLESALKQEQGEAIEQAIQQLFAAQDAEMAQGSSDVEGTWLQFKGMSLAIAYHLFKGDNLSAVYHFMMMADRLQYVKDTAPFDPADIWNIESLVVRTARRVRSALHDDMEAYKEALDLYCKADTPSEEATEASPTVNVTPSIGPCRLCGQHEATCKGSHLAPHFMIQSFLSFDGSHKRHTEVVNETKAAGYQKERKWGRAVPAEQIDEVFGTVPEEEKEAIRPSAVTRDFLFCNSCEKRFSLIETAYAASFSQHKACPDGLLAYVFWLGVFWRLSVGRMAIRLHEDDEKKIGALLNRLMPNDAKDIPALQVDGDMGTYAYSVFHCADPKGELSGIIGIHKPNPPYWLLLGEYVVVLYRDKSQVPNDVVANTYHEAEQWQEVAFIDYWKMKQKILDATREYELDHMGDGKEKCIDVVKGDHIGDLPSIFGLADHEMTMDDIGDRSHYILKIPGTLQKIMSLTENHPEADTAEKRMELIRKELGYTQDEVQEMFAYWDAHVKPLEVRKVGKKVRQERKKATPKKQAQAKGRKNSKKHKKKR